MANAQLEQIKLKLKLMLLLSDVLSPVLTTQQTVGRMLTIVGYILYSELHVFNCTVKRNLLVILIHYA